MRRRELREKIFTLLFRIEFYPVEEMIEQVELFFDDEDVIVSEEKKIQISAKYADIMMKLEEIDQSIKVNAIGWEKNRIGKVELTILRLGVYEILYDEEVPNSVAINEAVEIAKKFGQDTSGRFVNAILAKYV